MASVTTANADSVALWFKSIGHESWFSYYLTGMIAVSVVVYVFMRDTKARSAMHRHEWNRTSTPAAARVGSE
jgi:MFS transporter, MHS family, alpha-ketoglutarate permease